MVVRTFVNLFLVIAEDVDSERVLHVLGELAGGWVVDFDDW